MREQAAVWAGRWIRDRKVATKILTVAGVAVAGTVITGAVSLAGIGNLQSTRAAEVQRAVPYINNLNEAALAAKAAANDERGYLIDGDNTFRDESLGRQKTVDANLDAARALGDGTGQAAVDKIKAATGTWFAALDKEFTTYRTDPAAAIKLAMNTNRDLRKTYETVLSAEITRANDTLVEGKSFDATVSTIRTSVLSVFATSVLLAVVLALLIARMIVTPLR